MHIFGKEFDSDLINRYTCLIILTVVYYIVAFYIVKKYGLHCIIVVWAFPLLVVWLLLFNTHKSSESTSMLGYFTIAFALTAFFTFIAWYLSSMGECNNEFILAVVIISWILVSILCAYKIYH